MGEPTQAMEAATTPPPPSQGETEDTNAATVDDEAKEREELDSYINELKTKIEQKTKLRNENLSCVRPGEEFFFKLDSSLKKNTAFVKKLKQFTAAQLDSLLKDMSTLNLTKYISEVSSALSEAKLKLTDVNAAITLCSELHRVYADFPNAFLENWQKILSLKPGEKVQNPSKLRVDLKFFAELVSIGIFSNKQGLPMLGSILMSLIAQDKEDFNNLSIILSFCRHCGEEYAGLVPKSILTLGKKFDVQLPSSTLLTADRQQNLKNLLKDYYTCLVKHLKTEHKEYQSALRLHKKILESKGEVSSDRKEKLEALQSSFEKLISSAQSMSDLLNETLPELPKDEQVQSGVVLDMVDDSNDTQLDPWGDEETKSFYTELPDLRLFLPNYAPKIPEPVQTDEPALTEEALDMDIMPEQLEVEESAVLPEESGKLEDGKLEDGKCSTPEPVLPEETTSTGTGGGSSSTKQQFATFLKNLVNCVNKELIDSAAIEFLLNLNTKSNRKKLTTTIFGVKRTRLDLLPFFARLMATINLVSQDVAIDLCQKLKNEFKYHIAKKNQMNIESKIKVVRFIGEMTKFGLYSRIEALFCLKILLHDFQHHQIEMTCAFLEVAGQYLYNCKESRLRTSVYLEQMMRLKTVSALDSRHVAQIENSYYLVKPPEGMTATKKIRSPMQLYIRYLIYEELNKGNVDKIIKYMRRLNWDDKETYDYIVKCLSKAYNIRYYNIRCLADLASGISSYQDKAVVRVIDTVFEDIRAGLEIHSPKLAQRRIAMAKYLGELYNYRLIESTNVLNTLYSVISFGVTFSYEVVSEMDPPGSLFRLKLACVLLETCGQYFTSAVSRKKLDYFLVFFQHYYWFKKNDPIFSSIENTSDLFPILTDHYFKECLLAIRPKLKLYKSYEQAKEEVEKLQQELYPTLFTETSESESALGAIAEEGNDLTDTNNDNTEDTSEAFGSDDDGRQRHADEEDEDEENRTENDDLGTDTANEATDDLSPSNEPDPLAQPREKQRTQEDMEFEEAFEKMYVDSYQERLRESVKASKDIPVPMMTRAGKKTYDQIQSTENVPEKKDSVPFVLMLRGSKGGKQQQFKTFSAPTDSALAVNLRLQEQKIREENEKVKRLTLNITERIEEEDYQESLLQNQRSPAQNRQNQQRSQKQKYKHQKGAPDADLIFG